MRRPILAALGAAALVALAVPSAGADEAPEILTVITSPSAETQFMALILTTQAVAQGGYSGVWWLEQEAAYPR